MPSISDVIGILGGGLTGLLCGYLIPNSIVLEAEEIPGGLCRSINHRGFIFDQGPHSIFSKDRKLLLGLLGFLDGNFSRRYRRSAIYYRSRLIKYPFELGLGGLELRERLECISQYLIAKLSKPRKPGMDFKSWMVAAFGKAIASKYLIPYNAKLWKLELSQMGSDWVEKLPQPSLMKMILGALNLPVEGYEHQLRFYYPLRGGIQALTDGISSRLGSRLILGFRILRIEFQDGSWIVSDGKREFGFERLISTIPIQEFGRCSRSWLPRRFHQLISSLRYNSLILIGLGFKRPLNLDHSWIYFPQPELIFHRISFPGRFSEHNVPPGCSSILVEISSNPNQSWDLEKLSELVVEQLRGLNLGIPEPDFKLGFRVPMAYIIPDSNPELEILRCYLRERGIELAGRFSEFRYLNMDDCLSRAYQLAERYGYRVADVNRT